MAYPYAGAKRRKILPKFPEIAGVGRCFSALFILFWCVGAGGEVHGFLKNVKNISQNHQTRMCRTILRSPGEPMIPTKKSATKIISKKRKQDGLERNTRAIPEMFASRYPIK